MLVRRMEKGQLERLCTKNPPGTAGIFYAAFSVSSFYQADMYGKEKGGVSFMSEFLNQSVQWTNNILWSYIVIIMLLTIGIYFTIRTKFIQIRSIREMVRLLGDGIGQSGKSKNGVSSFQAFCIGMASRVGVGNIAGVAIAISYGGPGAVFWMWLIALIGSALAFVESTLAQIYKLRIRTDSAEAPPIIWKKHWGDAGWAFYFPSLLHYPSVWFLILYSRIRSRKRSNPALAWTK